jgi:hypothetical protein
MDTLLYSGNQASQKVSNHLSKETHSICIECPEDKTLGTCKFVPSVDAQTLDTLFLLTKSFICTECCRIRTHGTIYRACRIAINKWVFTEYFVSTEC